MSQEITPSETAPVKSIEEETAPRDCDEDMIPPSSELTGAERIAIERKRQIEEEGWTAEHDDGHTSGALAQAAACYASPRMLFKKLELDDGVAFTDPFPWSNEADKRPRENDCITVAPNNHLPKAARIRQLEIAGALIAAEIDRLLRLTKREKSYLDGGKDTAETV